MRTIFSVPQFAKDVVEPVIIAAGHSWADVVYDDVSVKTTVEPTV